MDYTNSKSVPFEIPDVNHGFQVAKGLMKLSEEGVLLEFETQDAFLGIIKSGVQTVTLDYENLEAIRLEKGWFSVKIILEANSMRVFEELPGSEQATCILKIKRKHKKEAQDISSRARVLLSEHKLNKLDDH